MNLTEKLFTVGFIYPLGKFCAWLPERLQFSVRLKIWRSLLQVKSLHKKQKKISRRAAKTTQSKKSEIFFAIPLRLSVFA
jgi:hypothetical protein